MDILGDWIILIVLQLAFAQPNYWSWQVISTDFFLKSPGRSDPDFRFKIVKPDARLTKTDHKI